MADASKTEKPTPRRLQKAREQGQVVRSRELSASLAALAALAAVAYQAEGFPAEWKRLFLNSLAQSDSPAGEAYSPQIANLLLRSALLPVLAAWTAALVSAVAQGGLVVAPTALRLQLSRLNPAQRFQQLFSLPAVGRLLKSILPATVILYLAAGSLLSSRSMVLTVGERTARAVEHYSMTQMFALAWKSGLVLLLWSGVDYWLERQKFQGDLRMSRQDLQEEYKETEGQPAVKSRIKRLQRQARRRHMLEAVKRASVVVTNPNEFAIALEYGAHLGAPVLIAKGRNRLAQRIKELARWHGIPLVENVPLAHALYRSVEVGQTIPPKLYAVVAGILAAIYRAQERAGRASAAGARSA
jgi:flagellar biosynthetic protein FlhB